MYKKARQNKIKNFIGVNADYEIPDSPDLIIDTDKLSVEESVNKLLLYLKNKNLIRN
jgi:adenylylsulfate kinase